MTISRRDFLKRHRRHRARSPPMRPAGPHRRHGGTQSAPYRAMVGVFLFGGNDGWNMVIPTDARHPHYLASRGTVGIAANAAQAAYRRKPTRSTRRWPRSAPLMGRRQRWRSSSTRGTLYAPLTKATYQSRADLRPMQPARATPDEQAHSAGHARPRRQRPMASWGALTDRMGAARGPVDDLDRRL